MGPCEKVEYRELVLHFMLTQLLASNGHG